MLVAKEYVLTAAHCVDAGDESSLAVQIGAVCPYSSGNCEQPIETINAANVIPHPFYDSATVDNDFALIKLTAPAMADPVTM